MEKQSKEKKVIQVYMNPKDRALIKKAGEIFGLSLSGFCRMAAVSEANKKLNRRIDLQ